MISTRDLDALATANGPELAVVIERVTGWVDQLSDGQKLDLSKAIARHEAWATACRAVVVAALYESAQAESAAISEELTAAHHKACDAAGKKRTAAAASHDFDDARLVDRQVGTEVALKLGISTRTADREVGLALDLRRWPVVAQALAQGRIDRAQAAVICAEVAALEDPIHQIELITSVLGPDETFDGDHDDGGDRGDHDVLGIRQDLDSVDPWELARALAVPLVRELRRPGATLWAIVPGRLQAILRREAARLEPQIVQERARSARDGRRVWLDPQPDFMANLTIQTTHAQACAAYRNIDASARAAKMAGDPRSLDQLRTDIGIGWLTEGAFGTLVTRPVWPGWAVGSPGDGKDERPSKCGEASSLAGALVPAGSAPGGHPAFGPTSHRIARGPSWKLGHGELDTWGRARRASKG